MSEDKTLLDDDMRPSKSERKREVLALTDLGRQLVDMSPHELAALPINSSLMEGIKLAQRVRNKHAAFKRQIQYIGKLIRSSDAQAILDAIDARQQAYLVEQKHFHALEQWRDRLINEGDAALHDVLEQWPHIDRQHIRQLIRTAQKQAETNKPPAAARELFKYLREISQA